MSKDFVGIAQSYALDVLLGVIPASIEARAAARRFLTPHPDYFLNNERAIKACEFIEKLPHVKGKWARAEELLDLSPWQVFSVVNIFGMCHKVTGLRKYRRVYIKVPRKNGKSTLVAAIALYMLMEDGEPGAEVYCGATSEKQAWEVFGPAHRMCEKDADIREWYDLTVMARNISVVSTFSKFEPVIGKPGDGASPSCAIVDEYHEHNTPDQYDTFDTGQGSRDEPLLIVITTAGDNIGGPCYELEDEARQVVLGNIVDETFFVLIFGIDQGDEWDTVEALKKANPNYGVSVSEKYLLDKLHTAKQRASARGIYKTKHLNSWVGARDAFFDVEKWIEAGDETLNIADHHHRECYVCIDLASSKDLAAAIMVFPPDDEFENWLVFSKFYLPETTVENSDNKNYSVWVEEGHITMTPGSRTDYDFIRQDILELARNGTVIECVYDPYQATYLVTQMLNDGLDMVEFGPTVRNFSEPMKELDGLILEDQITHDGNPVMNWNIGNVVAKTDAKDNVFPRKNLENQKIDGAVALIMGVGRCIAGREVAAPSVYETRGVLEI